MRTGQAEVKHRHWADLNKPSIMPHTPPSWVLDIFVSLSWAEPSFWREELSRQASLDIAINNPGPSQCRPDYCGSIKEKVLQWISVCARSSAAIFGCPIRESRPKPNGPLWPVLWCYFYLNCIFSTRNHKMEGFYQITWKYLPSFVKADCMIHFNGSKSIASVSNIIILLCSDEYLEIY